MTQFLGAPFRLRRARLIACFDHRPDTLDAMMLVGQGAVHARVAHRPHDRWQILQRPKV